MEKVGLILSRAKRLHFVGIGGSGMFPIVEIMLSLGYTVTGSDVNEGDIINHERKLGVPVNIPHDARAVDGADAVIVTAALLPHNPEVERASQLGIPIIKRSEILGHITSLYPQAFCISGTHGKTTTCSMLTEILLKANKDPAAVIGGRLPSINAYGRSGKGELMVCEACEFADTFLELSPAVSVVLNIDRDHLEYFKTVENLERSFLKFSNLASGVVLANRDDYNTFATISKCAQPVLWFGENEDSDYRIVNPRRRESAFYDFTLVHPNGSFDISLSAPGEHNVQNAAAAAACALLAGCEERDIADALFGFHGAGRRFETVGSARGITIVDDYAHHPAELEVTLSAAKQLGYRQVWAVFQPFTFSRTRMLLTDFAAALSIADHVVLTSIMGSREVNTTGIRSENLADLIPDAKCFDGFEEVAEYTVRAACEGDLIITLGCGDVYKCARIMLKKLNELE